jgi:hypothetical protein
MFRRYEAGFTAPTVLEFEEDDQMMEKMEHSWEERNIENRSNLQF